MILHIAALSSKHIMFPFIEFINKNFNSDNHIFILCAKEKMKLKYKNSVVKDIFTDNKYIFDNMLKADKIILHGIWYDEICKILLNNKLFFNKTYWIMWGGDFNFPKKMSSYKKEAIKKINYFITDSYSDYELAKKLYGCIGKHIKCFCYPSNLYKELSSKSNKHNSLHIQVGNSADPTNNHIDIFNKLQIYKEYDIVVFVPLSYGDRAYANNVIKIGYEIFGSKFKPLIKLLSFDEYVSFLGNIDIAFFNHNVQQAFGNIITLLGMGKKVYLNNLSPVKNTLESYNVVTFSTDKIDLCLLSLNIKTQNQKNIKYNFSEKKLIDCLNIFL